MARSKSSPQWLRDHFNDPYVKRAHKEGYRARSAFKLLDLQAKDKLFKSGMTVVDLGAAPGGWSQVIKQTVGPKGRVIALDILPMKEVTGVQFIQGDFREEKVLKQLMEELKGTPIDVVVSDMAPNISGITLSDQAQSMMLSELAFDFAATMLVDGGCFVVKLFQGAGIDEYIRTLRKAFQHVSIRKPSASRGKSREVYLVARGYKKH